MVPGFNTDFKYRGETYHVQTEDNGVGNPVVITLLYHKGAILASRRTPYHDLLAKPGFEHELQGLMKTQHKELMRSLLAGSFDKNGTAPAASGGSGKNPAEAAAAVACSTVEPAPVPPPAFPPRPAPSLRGGPAMRPAQAPTPKPMTNQAPGAAPRDTPRPVNPARATCPQPRALTLDEAIRRYLEEFAATAAAATR
jgi:hypothetical protein